MTFPIIIAAREGNIEAVKQHLAAGRYVDSEEFGRTSLHWAVKFGQKGIVELLIAKGADVNATNCAGKTSLDWAISNKQTETADLLSKHGGKTSEELKAEGK